MPFGVHVMSTNDKWDRKTLSKASGIVRELACYAPDGSKERAVLVNAAREIDALPSLPSSGSAPAALVLSIVNLLLEDVAEKPERLARAVEIAKRDITPLLSVPSATSATTNAAPQVSAASLTTGEGRDVGPSPAVAAPLIAYLDALFVSGNDVPTTSTLFAYSSLQIIKEMLAEGLPLDYHIVETEAVYRRKLAAYGDATRATSPLAEFRAKYVGQIP